MRQSHDLRRARALLAARVEAHALAKAPVTAVLTYLSVVAAEAESVEQLARAHEIAVHVASAGALLEGLVDILSSLEIDRHEGGT